MVSGLVMLAAASVSQIPLETESDMRCLAVLTLVVGRSDDKELQSQLIRSFYFFTGKITARDASLDVGPHIRRIFFEPEFSAQYRKAKFLECYAESETAREKMAKAGEVFSEGVR